MSLESFKNFVREKPNLANYVKSNEMTWQKFYEMYELYGSSSSVWDKYIGSVSNTSNTSSFKDMLNMVKNINMDELQKGIGSLQKGIGYIQDLIKSKDTSSLGSIRKEEYKPRPIYKHLDD